MNKTVFYKILCRLFCFVSVICTLSGTMYAGNQTEEHITISMQDVPLHEVMDAIKQQSRYLFINQGVDEGQNVSIDVKNMPVQDVCRVLFGPLDIDYTIEGETIIIKNRPADLPVTVKGTVVDAAGIPIPGVAVMEQGTANGITTDLDGLYTLTVSGPGSVLEFNCLGYRGYCGHCTGNPPRGEGPVLQCAGD